MNILQHTNEHQPTRMVDIYEALIGEDVVVFTTGVTPLAGKFVDYNGQLLHLTSNIGVKHTYIPVWSVLAISSDK